MGESGEEANHIQTEPAFTAWLVPPKEGVVGLETLCGIIKTSRPISTEEIVRWCRAHRDGPYDDDGNKTV